MGLNFDLLAEVFRNGVLIGSGELDQVPGGSTGWNGAVDRVINLVLSSPGTSGACAGDTLSIKLSVRVAASGKSSGTARLWYNGADANTRFGVTIAGVPSNLYLLNGFVLGTSPRRGASCRSTSLWTATAAIPGNRSEPGSRPSEKLTFSLIRAGWNSRPFFGARNR